MRTVVLGQRPPELEALIRSRARTGADRHDEVWEGEYHMAPAPSGPHAQLGSELAVVLAPLARRNGLWQYDTINIGTADDFRVPDRSLLRARDPLTWFPTAALVVEIVSPGDESWDKFGFYAAHEVDEVVIADPRDRSIHWFRRNGTEYDEVTRSDLLDVSVAEIRAEIDWPPTAD